MHVKEGESIDAIDNGARGEVSEVVKQAIRCDNGGEVCNERITYTNCPYPLSS